MRSLLPLLAIALLAAADEPAAGPSKGHPCDGAPQLTWDVFLPKAYAERPTERFPVLFLSSPAANPGFMGLEPWAERQEVVLVTINDSRNGDFAPIIAAQKAVTATVFAHLRLHHCLRFSTGFSGAGWASAVLGERFGDDWAGVLMNCNSQRGAVLKKHVAMAYIAGGKDTTYPAKDVRADWQSVKSSNPTRYKEVPAMGHENGPLEDRVAMLDWMLELERLIHPKLTPDELKAGMARLHQRVEELAKEADPARRAEAADGMLAADAVAKGKDGAALRTLWCAAMVAAAEAESDPVQQNRTLETVLGSDRAPAMAAADKKAALAKTAQLKKDKAVKADSDSRAALAQVAAAEAKSNGAKQRTQGLIADYQGIAKRWPDTSAGKDAAAAAERLQAGLK